MRIVGAEIKKLLKYPALWFLLLFFAVVNIGLLFSNYNCRQQLRFENSVLKETGIRADAQTVEKLQSLYDGSCRALDESYIRYFGKAAGQGRDYTALLRCDAAFSKIVQENGWLKDLLSQAKELCTEPVSMSAQQSLLNRTESGDPLIRRIGALQSAFFEKRSKQIAADGETQYLFPTLEPSLHTLLYSQVLFAFYIEMMVLSAVIFFSLFGFERTAGTEAVVFSSTRGRKNRADKRRAALIVLTGCFLLLGGLTLALFFGLYPLSAFFKMPIAAQNYDVLFPKLPFTFLSYLFCNLGVGFLLTLIFAAACYGFALFIPNAFFGMIAFFGLQGVLLLGGVEVYAGKVSVLGVLPALNPMTLLFVVNISKHSASHNCGTWFLLTNTCTSLPFFEIIVIVFSLAVCLIFARRSGKYFCRKEIV